MTIIRPLVNHHPQSLQAPFSPSHDLNESGLDMMKGENHVQRALSYKSDYVSLADRVRQLELQFSALKTVTPSIRQAASKTEPTDDAFMFDPDDEAADLAQRIGKLELDFAELRSTAGPTPLASKPLPKVAPSLDLALPVSTLSTTPAAARANETPKSRAKGPAPKAQPDATYTSEAAATRADLTSLCVREEPQRGIQVEQQGITVHGRGKLDHLSLDILSSASGTKVTFGNSFGDSQLYAASSASRSKSNDVLTKELLRQFLQSKHVMVCVKNGVPAPGTLPDGAPEDHVKDYPLDHTGPDASAIQYNWVGGLQTCQWNLRATELLATEYISKVASGDLLFRGHRVDVEPGLDTHLRLCHVIPQRLKETQRFWKKAHAKSSPSSDID